MIRKNEINVINTKPNPPTIMESSQIGTGKVQLSWNRGNDNQTLQSALTYNVYVGTNPGSCNIVSPMSNLSNGFRRIVDYGNATQDTFFILKNLKPGVYFWGVQSIDNSFAGSEFAPEHSFTILSTWNHEINDNYPLVTVFPNPSNDVLYIDLSNYLSEVNEIKIFNINGIEVNVNQMEMKTAHLVKIDASDFPPGIYFLRIKNNETICTKKIIIW
jgi:hypothetical protein